MEDEDEQEEPSKDDDSDAEEYSINIMDGYFQELAGNERGLANSCRENH